MSQLHFQIWRQRYALNLKPGFLLVSAFMFGLLCYLGIWQVQRYHFKESLVHAYEQNTISLPVPFTQIKNAKAVPPFQRVAVTGQYVNGLTVLLQNKPYHDRMGFEVITPLKLADDKALLLVDRGWVAGNQSAPDIRPVLEPQHISGEIKLLNEHQFILGNNILDVSATPMQMQKIDVTELSKTTHQEFYPYLLRLNASAPHGFIRDWVITAVQPERHLGYAIQWFVMALVLMIASFCFCCERLSVVKD